MLFTKALKIAAFLCPICLLFLVSACSESDNSKPASEDKKKKKIALVDSFTTTKLASDDPLAQTKTSLSPSIFPSLSIYKSATCLCCQSWIHHIEQHGFSSQAYNVDNLGAFKQSKKIAPRYRPCHTTLSDSGYVFEGHIPAKFIMKFLAKPPQHALGLAVPAMPVGSPGMEMGDRFMPYQVIQLNSDGSDEVYAEITTYEEQF